MKQWKVNPPGEEQITLEAMFEEGGIADYETAATVQARNELFKPFSDRVFASHFNKTRAKFGYGIAGNFKENRFEKFRCQKLIFFKQNRLSEMAFLNWADKDKKVRHSSIRALIHEKGLRHLLRLVICILKMHHTSSGCTPIMTNGARLSASPFRSFLVLVMWTFFYRTTTSL